MVLPLVLPYWYYHKYQKGYEEKNGKIKTIKMSITPNFYFLNQ